MGWGPVVSLFPICTVVVDPWDGMCWAQVLGGTTGWRALSLGARSQPGEETVTKEPLHRHLKLSWGSELSGQRRSQGGGMEAGSDPGWLMASAKALRPRATLSQVAGSPPPGHTVS